MEELYRVTNDYYTKLESFKAYGAFKNLYFLGVLVSAVFFIVFAGFLLQEILIQKKQNIYSWWFFLTIGSECFMLLMMNKLRDKKEKNIIKLIETQTKNYCESVEEAKVELLKSYSPLFITKKLTQEY